MGERSGQLADGGSLTIAVRTGALCLLSSLASAWLWVAFTSGRTTELLGLMVYSLPLAFSVAVFARRPRFASRRPVVRTVLTTITGVALTFGMTVVGFALLGGWMLAWDFPILYVWLVGSTLSTLAAGLAHQMISPSGAVGGALVVAATAGTLGWNAARPAPALMVTYREAGDSRTAELIHDSLLTEPSVSGTGYDLRWDMRSYAVVGHGDSTSVVFLTFDRATDRDSARAALQVHPLVQSIADTTH